MKNYISVTFLVVKYKLFYCKAFIKNGFKRKVILCYPQKPKPTHVLCALCHILGYKITNNPNKHVDVIMNFEDWTMRKENPILDKLGQKQRIINVNCRNISKAKVDRVFADVFGYSIKIDSRQYIGQCVRKSNINAMHDGKILQCPMEPEEGYVYQRVINNQHNETTVMDMRVSFMNGTIPMVVRRFRGILDRFGNTDNVSITNLKNEFTDEEIKKIIIFCQTFGIDYADLDVLRDKNDGKIYIVDVNNTPYGPIAPKHFTRNEHSVYINSLAIAFDKEFCR